MIKRTVVFLCAMMLVTGGLIIRLLDISTNEISKEASAMQSRRVLTLAKTRAGITDRNFVPLVNKSSERRLLIFPELLDVSAILEFSHRDELADAFQSFGPTVIDSGGKITEGEGIYNFSYPKRYGEKTPAPHIIGYLNGGKGACGIERSYNAFLEENSKTVTVSYFTDGIGRLLQNGEIILEEDEEAKNCKVVLTLDSEIQRVTERALSKLEKGAAVVMDCESGEILASASAPSFEPCDVAAYLEAEDSPFINRAFTPYSVGSTWKLVVAAAALDMGIKAERTFTCDGSVTVDGRTFKCHWEAGHGEIDMEKALEISCNPYFIDLALEVGGEKILETAENLGFGSAADFGDGFSSAKGSLPTREELLSKAALSSFAFGQGSLMATPLQMASLVSAIANGGRAVTPKLVKGTLDKEENFVSTAEYAKNPAMKSATAKALRKMMINVVEKGSGENAKPKNGGAGGKTASAQTGQFDENKNEIIHAWFVGFYPAEKPRWAVAVFAEGMNSGGDFAAPVFREICDGIDLLNYD